MHTKYNFITLSLSLFASTVSTLAQFQGQVTDSVSAIFTPDPRTTIYWNGDIVTDANGETSISFYTGDNITNYTITVTGLTANGDLVYKRVIIENKGKGR